MTLSQTLGVADLLALSDAVIETDTDELMTLGFGGERASFLREGEGFVAITGDAMRRTDDIRVIGYIAASFAYLSTPMAEALRRNGFAFSPNERWWAKGGVIIAPVDIRQMFGDQHCGFTIIERGVSTPLSFTGVADFEDFLGGLHIRAD